jgi:hypothetical protein
MGTRALDQEWMLEAGWSRPARSTVSRAIDDLARVIDVFSARLAKFCGWMAPDR